MENNFGIYLKKKTRRFLMKCSYLHVCIIAASYQCVRPVRIQYILMSIVFHHYKKLFQLYKTDIKFAKIDLT